MIVLITGGCGFIGSCCAHILSCPPHNHTVYILDRVAPNDRLTHAFSAHSNVHFLPPCDMRSESELTRVLRENGVECVVHAAAFIAVEESESMPMEYWDNNVACTARLLQAMHASNVKYLGLKCMKNV